MEKTVKRPSMQKAALPGVNGEDMAVIIRGVPPTYNWGWFSREDQRMHLQTVDRAHLHLHYKIWLENKGHRVFEPEPGIPAKVLKVVQKVVADERERVEAEWAAFMIRNTWLKVRYANGIITLYAYPRSPNHFERTLELRELIPNEEIAQKVTEKQVGLNEEFACLEIFPERREGARDHEPLGRVLWVD
jgi:hypothetical protein